MLYLLDANLICGVTTKYLKAITRKIWIVSIRWILSSIQANQLLDPVSSRFNHS